MAILILAEHDGETVKPATLSAVTAAKEIGGEITLLLLGTGLAPVAAKAAHINGVCKIITGENAAFKDDLAETAAAAILSLASGYDTILSAATTFGKNILPRVAAKLDLQQISDVMIIESPQRFVRPIYAGNALQTIETTQARNVLTIRSTNFAAAALLPESHAQIETHEFIIPESRARFISREIAKSERPELTSAKIVVSGGRGVGSKENFRIIEELADDLGAAVGASRAAVDAGYVPNDYQVGQTGKIVAPDIYIAIGISGAIQHLAGMTGAKTIVAINKDADAPIFQVADYGLVGDLFDILPKLREELKRPRS